MMEAELDRGECDLPAAELSIKAGDEPIPTDVGRSGRTMASQASMSFDGHQTFIWPLSLCLTQIKALQFERP
jgi:hypothetical protein